METSPSESYNWKVEVLLNIFGCFQNIGDHKIPINLTCKLQFAVMFPITMIVDSTILKVSLKF